MRYEGTMLVMGYVQDGSDTTVTLWQDNTAQGFFVNVGKREYCGRSLCEAFDKAILDNKK